MAIRHGPKKYQKIPPTKAHKKHQVPCLYAPAAHTLTPTQRAQTIMQRAHRQLSRRRRRRRICQRRDSNTRCSVCESLINSRLGRSRPRCRCPAPGSRWPCCRCSRPRGSGSSRRRACGRNELAVCGPLRRRISCRSSFRSSLQIMFRSLLLGSGTQKQIKCSE